MHVQSVQKYYFSFSNMQISGIFRRGCLSSLLCFNGTSTVTVFQQQSCSFVQLSSSDSSHRVLAIILLLMLFLLFVCFLFFLLSFFLFFSFLGSSVQGMRFDKQKQDHWSFDQYCQAVLGARTGHKVTNLNICSLGLLIPQKKIKKKKL